MTDFKEKAKLFNSYFAAWCPLIYISNRTRRVFNIWLTIVYLLSLSLDKIAKQNQNFDPNKAYGHDNISIRMLQISIYKPQETSGVFISKRRKDNFIPIHKREDKQTSYNCSPVTLLSIWLMFKEMFHSLLKTNSLLCISLLLSKWFLGQSTLICYSWEI